jgi:hypothetical protein
LSLPALFSPALAQIESRWASLSQAQRDTLVRSLPSLAERHACLDWNARLSAHSPAFLEACQAVYAALVAWESLSDIERITVTMAGIEPTMKAAAALGLVAGVPKAVPS